MVRKSRKAGSRRRNDWWAKDKIDTSWGGSDLAVLAKGDLRKIEIAQRLREETVVTVKWIAERLWMGSVAYVNNRLYLKRKGKL